MLSRIRFTIKYIYLIIGAILAIESTKGDELSGEAKKKAVMDSLVSLLEASGISMGDKKLGVLDDLIDLIVSLFNAVGEFRGKDDRLPLPD